MNEVVGDLRDVGETGVTLGGGVGQTQEETVTVTIIVWIGSPDNPSTVGVSLSQPVSRFDPVHNLRRCRRGTDEVWARLKLKWVTLRRNEST